MLSAVAKGTDRFKLIDLFVDADCQNSFNSFCRQVAVSGITSGIATADFNFVAAAVRVLDMATIDHDPNGSLEDIEELELDHGQGAERDSLGCGSFVIGKFCCVRL